MRGRSSILWVSTPFSHSSCEGKGFPKAPIPSSSSPNGACEEESTLERFTARGGGQERRPAPVPPEGQMLESI